MEEREDDGEKSVHGKEGKEPMSKNQQKKLLRSQKFAEWKDTKRQLEKEKRKARRLERRMAGEDLGKAKREANEIPKCVSLAKLVIDLSFDDLMTEKEVLSMTQQLSSLYNANRQSSGPFTSIIFAGPPDQLLYDTRIGSRMQTKMKAQWQRWKSIVLRERGGLEGLDKIQEDQKAICKRSQLVYLTADSSTTLERIQEDKTYIIGGLVDRNRHKRLCADKADRLGIQTARLPIEPGRLSASTVLTVNQVVEILLAFNETLDWDSTLDKCLPRRKVRKEQAQQTDHEQEGTDEDNTMYNTQPLE